jgi:acetyl esterase/lipase
MLPESSGVEILADVDDFWKWLHTSEVTSMLSALPTPIELDLDRILLTGESAGGLLSVYLALTFPDEIRSAIASYPMFNQDGSVDGVVPTRQADETAPESLVIDHLQNIKSGEVVSSSVNPSRFALAFASIAHDKLLEFYERDADVSAVHSDRLFQLRRLDQPSTRLPRGGLVILHGREDPIVPVNLSERFVRVAKQKLHGRQGADHIVLTIKEGGHGFDNPVSMEEPWLQKALQTAIATWLE